MDTPADRNLVGPRAESDAPRDVSHVIDLPDRQEPNAIILDTLAHDMRRYLTPIIGCAQTLVDRGTTLEEGEQAEFSRIIVRNAELLDHLLREMIDLQRFEAGAWVIYRRMTDVRELINGLVPSLAVGQRSLTVIGDGPPVSVDPGLLERIIENLVANAKAHTPQGTPIMIRTSSDSTGANITVQDAGPGVPEDMKSAIFEPFRSPGGGTGLGLALVARFAQLHGGRVWVEDAEGGGATFRVHLPAKMGKRRIPHTQTS